jgi:cytochrome oxidase assembly protein ShyY1
VVLPLIFFFPQILNYIQVWNLFRCHWQMTFKEKISKALNNESG